MANSPLSVGAQTRLSLVREATFNQIPANPKFQIVRPTDLTLSVLPKFDQSKEIRSDGMDAAQILVDQDITAKYGTEFSADTDDDIIEAGFRTTKVATPEINTVTAGVEITSVVVTTGVYNVAAGTGTPFLVGHLVKASGFANAANNATSRATATGANAVTLGGVVTVAEATPPVGARLKVVGIRGAAAGSIAAVTGPNAITVATTNPSTLGVVPGMWLRLSGFTGTVANNDLVRVGPGGITGAGPWTIPLDIVPTGWAADAAAGQVISIYFTDYFRPGNTRSSYAAEEAHLDSGDFKYETGLVIDSLQKSLKQSTTIPVTVQMVGCNGGWQAQAAGATYKARTTTLPLNTANNLGKVYINGAWVSGVITSADVTFKANAKVQKALGTFGGADITFGPFQISGTLEKYFIDSTLNAQMMAGTPINLVFVERDPATGTTYVTDIRSVQLMEGQPPVPNSTDPIKEPYKFTANPNDGSAVAVMCHVQKLESLPAVGV